MRLSKLICIIFLIFVGCSVQAEPNFLVIVTDDQINGTVTEKIMPHTKKEIFDKGINFKNAFISNSTCCPSRASIFTGLYSKNNGVFDNKTKDLRINGCGYYLKEAGYTVGITGKYLNTHGRQQDYYTKSNFDFWAVNGKKLDPSKPNYNLNGVNGYMDVHTTQWTTRHALDFLRNTPEKFLLYVTFNAPHGLVPVDKDFNHMYHDYKFKKKPSFNTAFSDKPKWIQNLGRRKDHKRKYINQMKKLQVVDLSIKALLDELKSQGRLEETYIIFISDNGIHTGEFKLSNKWTPYDETIHVPMAIKGPGILPEVSKKLVGNIDIAPTIYSLSGVNGGTVDGINMLTGSRRYFFLQGGYLPSGRKQVPYSGIISKRYRLVNTKGDISEFYNVRRDPYQMNNIYYKGINTRRRDIMQRKLNKFNRS